MKKVKASPCISCGKKDLSKDEVGINLKLIGEDTKNFYCLDCLANVLDVSNRMFKKFNSVTRIQNCMMLYL